MNRTILLVLIVVCLFLQAGVCQGKAEGTQPGRPDRPAENKIFAFKLQKNISLDDLIVSSGYSISDEDVVVFMTDFLNLNPSVKSISTLKKGMLVRVPLKHLKKVSAARPVFREKEELGALKRTIMTKKERSKAEQEPVRVDRAVVLNNVRELFTLLGEQVTIDQEGFKLFQISEKSELSFDTGLFPVVDLHNEHILIIDYTGSFPDEMKNLIEVSWPEYRVVHAKGRFGFGSIVPALLHESGYAFSEDGKMVSGGGSQIEYHADYLVYGKNGAMMENDISLISILDKNELQTPGELVAWFGKRDIRVIELSEYKKRQMDRRSADFIALDTGMGGREFTEKILTLWGYPYNQNTRLSLSPRKEITYALTADISIALGRSKKVIDFSEISDLEIQAVQKLGLDIVRIEPFEQKKGILKKIMSLLSLNRSDTPKTNAPYLTPKGSRYRLLLPGNVVRTPKGQFFMTGSELDGELLKKVVTDGVTVIQF